MITKEQSRAARGLIDWSQTQLAENSNLSESTIRDFEKGRRVPNPNNLSAIKAALEAAGIVFIPETGGGAGVRLKFTRLDVKQIDRLENEGGPAGENDVL